AGDLDDDATSIIWVREGQAAFVKLDTPGIPFAKYEYDGGAPSSCDLVEIPTFLVCRPLLEHRVRMLTVVQLLNVSLADDERGSLFISGVPADPIRDPAQCPTAAQFPHKTSYDEKFGGSDDPPESTF